MGDGLEEEAELLRARIRLAEGESLCGLEVGECDTLDDVLQLLQDSCLLLSVRAEGRPGWSSSM